jgi:competence protein ComEA
MIRHLIAAAVTALAVFALDAHAAADANQATQAELESVKGIGPGLSGKIIDARKTGVFKSWDDLVERVGGIGPGNAARLSQNGLTVAGNPYPGSNAAPAPNAKAGKSDKNDKSEKGRKTDA